MRRKLGLVLIDVFCFVLSAFGAQVLRDNLYFRTDRLYEMLPYAALSLCVAVLVLPAFGLHRRMWRYSNVNDLIRIAGAVITSISLTLVAGFSLFRLAGVARSLPILHGVLALSLMSLCRLAAKYIQTRRDAANFSKLATGPQLGSKADETVLVIGLNNVSKLFLASVAEYAPERIAVAGLLAVTEDHEGRIFQGYKIVGSPENLARVLETLEVEGVIVDRIVVTTRFEDLSGEAKAALLDVEKRTNIIVDFFAERIGMGKDWPEPRKPHHDESPPDSNERTVSAALRNFAGDVDPDRQFWRTKRVIDFCVAAVMLLALSPLVVVVAAIVGLNVGMPVMFVQQRPGTNGRPFKVFKFRTMDAPHDTSGRRIPDNVRLGPVGRVLRHLRLDELPQLFNILLGEMSFVGPRPLLPRDQPADVNMRLMVRPGLTGWAQVNGGRYVSALDKAALDLWYMKNASLVMDMKIMFRTIMVVLGKERANIAAIDVAWYDINAVQNTKVGAATNSDTTRSPTANGAATTKSGDALLDAAE